MNTESSSARQSSEIVHESYLDSLRGWAILGVFAVHIGGSVRNLPEIFHHFLDRGQFGVQLFFVVSAFTLCQSADRSGGPERFQASAFFIRRALRIVPAYWLASLAYFALAVFDSAQPADAMPKLLASLLFINYLNPAWFISNFPPGGWSIVAEVFFYLAFPFLYAWIRTARHAVLGLILSLSASLLLARLANGIDLTSPSILASLAVNSTSYFGIVAQLPFFLCGFLAARTDQRLLAWRGSSPLIAVAILSVFLVKDVPASLGMPLLGLLFGAFLSSFRNRNFRVFVNPLIAGLGRISYSMYLVHFAAISLSISLWATPLTGFGDLIALIALSFTSTVLISIASYRLVEQPFVAMGRRLTASKARS